MKNINIDEMADLIRDAIHGFLLKLGTNNLIVIWQNLKLDIKEPYIKYVGGGAGGFLWGSWNILGIYWLTMKYFSKFLMGHEIFSDVLLS